MIYTDFEKAFADFIDRREYDEAESALFSMIRTSFIAGWESAGGNPPKSQPIVELIREKPKDPSSEK